MKLFRQFCFVVVNLQGEYLFSSIAVGFERVKKVKTIKMLGEETRREREGTGIDRRVSKW